LKKKYIFAIFMAFVLLILSLVPVNAVEYSKEIITPMYAYISQFRNDFNISGAGNAEILTELYASGSDELRVTGYLQQYKDGGWRNVKSWTESNAGNIVVLDQDWGVESGYKYRYISFGYVYVEGYTVESTNYESNTVWY
jgi:hypothetical protein